MTEDDAAAPSSGAKAVLIYNLSRLALLAVCLVIGWFAGLRGLYWIAGSFLVSGVLSWFLLAKQRMGMGVAIERTVERGRAKMAERTAAEDEYDDSLRAAGDSVGAADDSK